MMKTALDSRRDESVDMVTQSHTYIRAMTAVNVMYLHCHTSLQRVSWVLDYVLSEVSANWLAVCVCDTCTVIVRTLPTQTAAEREHFLNLTESGAAIPDCIIHLCDEQRCRDNVSCYFCRAVLCVSAAYVVGRCLSAWMSATFVYCVETAKDRAIAAVECVLIRMVPFSIIIIIIKKQKKNK